MHIFLVILLFAVGIILIVKGGDYFVDAASWMAEVSGIPKLIVGATVVSFATTLPELLVSAFAAAQGKVDMSIGNAVGSVTANLGLIMAIALICMPTVIKRRDYMLKSCLMLGAAPVPGGFWCWRRACAHSQYSASGDLYHCHGGEYPRSTARHAGRGARGGSGA